MKISEPKLFAFMFVCVYLVRVRRPVLGLEWDSCSVNLAILYGNNTHIYTNTCIH